MTAGGSRGRRRPVGLTGGMGAGKSSAARFLRQRFGLAYIDADVICRQLLEPEASGWHALVDCFGGRFLAPDRSVDRPRLRDAIFADPALRQQLDRLLHPLARRELHRRLAALAMVGRCLVEVPLLYEAGWEAEFDGVVVVYAPFEQCRARLCRRDRISGEAAELAMAAQIPLAEKALRAGHVIDNSGPWHETCLQLLHLGEVLWGEARGAWPGDVSTGV